MTFSEYKKIIEDWAAIANSHGIKLSNGNDLPLNFWKTFLGIKRSVHVEMMNGTYKRKSFSLSLLRTIEITNLLSEKQFIDEVKRVVPLYECDKNS